MCLDQAEIGGPKRKETGRVPEKERQQSASLAIADVEVSPTSGDFWPLLAASGHFWPLFA